MIFSVLDGPISATICQLLVYRSNFHLLQVPFNGNIKLASYYSSQHINMPVTTSMITHTMRVHATSLDNVTDIASKSLSSISSHTREDGAVARWVWSKCYQIAGSLEKWHNYALFAPTILAGLPKPGSKDVQQWNIYVLTWQMGPGRVCCLASTGRLILFLPPSLCSLPDADGRMADISYGFGVCDVALAL